MFDGQEELENNLVDPELEESKVNLKNDIEAIDIRLIDITKNINLLQSNIDRMTNILINTNHQQNQNMGKYYSIQSELLKTLSSYNDNYEKLLNLKFKYRSEQNNLSLRIIRLYEIEMKRVYNNLDSEEVNYKSVMNAISNMGADNKPVLEFDEDEKI